MRERRCFARCVSIETKWLAIGERGCRRVEADGQRIRLSPPTAYQPAVVRAAKCHDVFDRDALPAPVAVLLSNASSPEWLRSYS